MTRIEKERVRQMRLEGISHSQIASGLGLSVNTVKSYCRRNNLPGGGIAFAPKTDDKGDNTCCKQCGKRLVLNSKHKPKKFCSDKCRRAWWRVNNVVTPNRKAFYNLTCACCGKKFESYGNKDRKYCGHACYIKDRFKGGESHDARAI